MVIENRKEQEGLPEDIPFTLQKSVFLWKLLEKLKNRL